MCLEAVHWVARTKADVTDDEEIGYKVFVHDKQSGALVSPLYGYAVCTKEWSRSHCGWAWDDVLDRPRSSTLRDRLEANDDKRYPCGFHVFTTRAAANQYLSEGEEVVRRVRVRKIVARGTQKISHKKVYPCIIAQEMRLA